MPPIDLVKACQQCLGQEAEELQGALVYLDQGAAEAFQFAGGLPIFLQLGVRAICDLELASSTDAEISWNTEEAAWKIVIVTSQLLSDCHRYILRCLRLHPEIHRCIIYTSISEDAHSDCPDTPLGTDAFSEYRDLLLQDLFSTDQVDADAIKMRSDVPSNLDVTLKHLPLLCCPLTPRVFVFPSNATIAAAPLSKKDDNSFLSRGLPGCDNGRTWDDDENASVGATLHAHFLHQLGTLLDLKFDIFSLGPLSHMIGKQLTTISTSHPDGSGRQRRPAGLLLLDRTLDLITPSSHGDSLVDRIYASLPRQASSSGSEAARKEPVERPPVTVRIPSFQPTGPDEKVQEVNVNLQDTPIQEPVAGSISTAWDLEALDGIDTLFDKKAKDGAVLIRKWLQDAVRKENIEFPGKPRMAISCTEIRSLVGALLGNPVAAMRQAGLIQLGKAAAEVLNPAHASKWETIASAEKILSISATDGLENLAFQVLDLVKQSSDRSSVLTLRDALTVVIVAYGLAGEYTLSRDDNSGGPFSWEEERALKEAILEAVLRGQGAEFQTLGFLKGLENALEKHWHAAKEDHKLDDWSEEQWENWDEDGDGEQQEFSEIQLKLELNDRIQELFNVLHNVSVARARYPSRTIRLGPGVFKGLVTEVFSLLLSKADIPGVKHHASTVGRLLKSGLGRFGIGQTKPKLADHKVLLVFIVGGINALEVREARALQGDFEELIIGGTTFLTAEDMYKLLLGSCEF